MKEYYEIFKPSQEKISLAMKTIRNVAKRMDEPELQLAIDTLEDELLNIPRSFTISVDVEGSGIAHSPEYFGRVFKQR